MLCSVLLHLLHVIGAVAPASGTGFTQEHVVLVGTALAASVSKDYLAENPGRELVTLEDSRGWVPNWKDVVGAADVIIPFLHHDGSRIPSLVFVTMCILVADSVLNSKVVKRCETEAMKYGGRIRVILSHLRYLRRCSVASRNTILSRLKSMVVFVESNPYRRARPKQSQPLPRIQPALGVVQPLQLQGMPAMSSTPSIAELAALRQFPPAIETFGD